MNQVVFSKLQLYSFLTGKRILVIDGLLESGKHKFFLIDDFVEYAPTSNIHKNALRRGKDLESILNSSLEYDRDSLVTKLEEINYISLEFPNSYKWFIIK